MAYSLSAPLCLAGNQYLNSCHWAVSSLEDHFINTTGQVLLCQTHTCRLCRAGRPGVCLSRQLTYLQSALQRRTTLFGDGGQGDDGSDRRGQGSGRESEVLETRNLIGVFICHCGINTTGTVDVERVAEEIIALAETERVVEGLG